MIRPPLTPRKANDPLASVVVALRWVLILADGLDHRIGDRFAGVIHHPPCHFVTRQEDNPQRSALFRFDRVEIVDVTIDIVWMEELDDSFSRGAPEERSRFRDS